MRAGARLVCAVCALAAFALAQDPAAASRSEIRLSSDGWFRRADGSLFVPLGGFHGNVLPLAFLKLSHEEYRRVEPHLFSAQLTAGKGHVDLWDASDEMLRRWFGTLAGNGITTLRLFPRARVDGDTLDLCGKLNPELQQVFHRAFAAARPYGIRFLLQILPEPTLSGYWHRALFTRHALPRYSAAEMERLTAAQRRFLIGRKQVRYAAWFADPDVLACQKLYLEQALAWIATEPQVFALEVYNEQGWSRPPPGEASGTDWEEAEIAWTAEIVRFIHERLPGVPVTISHPGYGLAGYDPIRWSRRTGVDFYSMHFYAGDCGENSSADFAAVTAAASAVVRAAVVNFPGEWGILNSRAPEKIRRRAHRDVIWLTLLADSPGFLQWTYEFLDEYRWPARVFDALGRSFSPDEPSAKRAIGAEWDAFQNSPAAQEPPAFRMNPDRRSDPNLRAILDSYAQSLAAGVRLGFTLGGSGRDAGPQPLSVEGGYQLSWLGDAAHRTWIAYLRSRKVKDFGGQFLGVPVRAPLRIRFALPEGHYDAVLVDLGANRLRRFEAAANSVRKVSRGTDADYLLVVGSKELADALSGRKP